MDLILNKNYSVCNFFRKHTLSPRIIDENTETYQIVRSLKTKSTSGVYILHNHICSLLGDDVYIIRYYKSMKDVKSEPEIASLIPVFYERIVYVCYHNDQSVMKILHDRLECFNINRFYYDCPLHTLIRSVEECTRIRKKSKKVHPGLLLSTRVTQNTDDEQCS